MGRGKPLAQPLLDIPGSGLGLSIVRQVAELHGGSAGAEPARPKGLRVIVTIPRVD